MIPKEILRKVRHIEIRTRGLVNELFGGEYLSVFNELIDELSHASVVGDQLAHSGQLISRHIHGSCLLLGILVGQAIRPS